MVVDTERRRLQRYPFAQSLETWTTLNARLERRGQQARVRPFAIADAEREDLLEELRVAQTAVRRGIREVFVLGDLRIGVGLEQIEDAVVRESVIEPRISAEAEMPVDALGKALDMTRHFRRQVRRFCY